MDDERLGRHLRSVDGPATPRPEFVEDLFVRLEAEGGFATTDLSPGRSRRRRRRTSWPLLLVAALVVGGGVISAVVMTGGSRSPATPAPAAVETAASPAGSATPVDAAERPTVRPTSSLLRPDVGTTGLDILQDSGVVVYERRVIGKLTRLQALTGDSSSREFVPGVPGTQRGAAWSPDGRHLAFAAAEATSPAAWRVWQTDQDGTSPTLLSFGCELPSCYGESEPAYSPDGLRLAVVRTTANAAGEPDGYELEIKDLATGRVTELPSTRRPLTQRLLHPSWSPDGARIAYAVEQRDPDGIFLGSAIWVVGTRGDAPQQLTDDALLAGDPAWAPDGKQILFGSFPIRSTWAENQRDPGATHLYVMNADGTDVRQYPINDPVGAAGWTADGDEILLTEIVNAGDYGLGATWLVVLDPAGTSIRVVTRSGNCCSWYAAQQPTP